MPDPDQNAGAFDGVEHGLRVGLAERKRFLAIDVLAGSGERFHLLTVPGVRRREHHSLDRLVGQNFIK